MRALLTNDRDQRPDCLSFVGVDESLATPRRGALHARVAPATRATQVDGCADAQRAQRLGELADSVAAELVRVIDGELGPAVADDLAFLAERAGDDADLCPAGGVVRDGGAVAEALVVGMRMHEQQPGRLGHGRTLTRSPTPSKVDTSSRYRFLSTSATPTRRRWCIRSQQ